MRILPPLLVASILITAAFGQTVQTIYSFPSDGSLGERPAGTLAVGPGGDLYGTTSEGGIGDNGTAFRISTTGVFTSLGSFDPSTTGRLPYSRLINIGDGFLYGVAERNTGVSGDPNGTLFKLDPVAGLSVVFSLPPTGVTPKFPRALLSATPGSLHVLGSTPGGFWVVPLDGSPANSFNLDGNTVGSFPYSATLGSDGRIYGTCEGVTVGGSGTNLRGTLFRVDADGANLVRLHECEVETGTSPHGAMVLASDGNFYGTMGAAGANSRGCIFRLTPDGDYTVIYHFDSLATPQGDLIQASDGFLYGTTRSGGSAGLGGVFRISLSGSFTALISFSGTDGSNPLAGLIQAGDGNLYGTTYEGGTGGKGVIFRVTLEVASANRAPIALDNTAVTSGANVIVNVLGNDFDPEGEALAVTDVSTPTFGTATILGDNTILYAPGIGFSGSDSFTYTIRDPEGATAMATVTIQSEPVDTVVYSGVFNGLLNLDPELLGDTDLPRAQFFVNINSLGSFTGLIVTQRKRFTVRGQFDLTDGTASASVKLPGKEPALLFLGFRSDEPGTLLAVVFGSEVWSGDERPLRGSDSVTNEKHTVSIGGVITPGMPDGYGYGIMTIKPSGLVKCVGRHGDGKPLSWGTTLVAATDGAALIPVFHEPIAGAVSAGVLDSRVSPLFDYVATLRWKRSPVANPARPYAAGFAGQTTAVISRFNPQPSAATVLDLGADGTGTLALDKGPLPGPIGGDFSFNGSKISRTTPLKKLAINRKNGLVTGSVRNGKQTLTFRGVVNQPNNFATGQFQTSGVTGEMQIAP